MWSYERWHLLTVVVIVLLLKKKNRLVQFKRRGGEGRRLAAWVGTSGTFPYNTRAMLSATHSGQVSGWQTMRHSPLSHPIPGWWKSHVTGSGFLPQTGHHRLSWWGGERDGQRWYNFSTWYWMLCWWIITSGAVRSLTEWNTLLSTFRVRICFI